MFLAYVRVLLCTRIFMFSTFYARQTFCIIITSTADDFSGGTNIDDLE